MGRYTSKTDNSTQLKQIWSFYCQFEEVGDTLEVKYISHVSRSKDWEIEQLLPSIGMVLRMLKKIHDKILRGLRSCDAMEGRFYLLVPPEEFKVNLRHIIQSINFGHRFEETRAYRQYRSAVFL